MSQNLGESRENKKHKNRAYDTFDQDQFLWNVSLKHIFHFFLAHRNLEHALPSLEAAMQAVNSIDKGQLILKCPFGVFKSSQKPMNFFLGFLP